MSDKQHLMCFGGGGSFCLNQRQLCDSLRDASSLNVIFAADIRHPAPVDGKLCRVAQMLTNPPFPDPTPFVDSAEVFFFSSLLSTSSRALV